MTAGLYLGGGRDPWGHLPAGMSLSLGSIHFCLPHQPRLDPTDSLCSPGSGPRCPHPALVSAPGPPAGCLWCFFLPLRLGGRSSRLPGPVLCAVTSQGEWWGSARLLGGTSFPFCAHSCMHQPGLSLSHAHAHTHRNTLFSVLAPEQFLLLGDCPLCFS